MEILTRGKPEELITQAVVDQQRERHVRMYERRLESGSRAVVVGETLKLMAIWRGMVGRSWRDLTLTERCELIDALFDDGWEFGYDGADEVEWVAIPKAIEPLWWLSYAGEDVSHGVVVVRAGSFLDAVAKASRLGLSPGGQVRGFEAPQEQEPALARYEGQWLAPDEARELAK